MFASCNYSYGRTSHTKWRQLRKVYFKQSDYAKESFQRNEQTRGTRGFLGDSFQSVFSVTGARLPAKWLALFHRKRNSKNHSGRQPAPLSPAQSRKCPKEHTGHTS